MSQGSGSRQRSRSTSTIQSASSGNNSNPGSSQPPRCRGKALNSKLDKLIKGGMIRPKIEFKAGLARPVGNWGKEFLREVGLICRGEASLSCHIWKDIKELHGNYFYDLISEKFDVDFAHPDVRKIVNTYMAARLREHRYMLYAKYQALGDDVDKTCVLRKRLHNQLGLRYVLGSKVMNFRN